MALNKIDQSTEGPSPSQIVEALTWARTRPAEVLEALQARRRHYQGRDYFPPERGGRCIVTKEGTAAVDDALAYVGLMQPMAGVGNSSEAGLEMAAEDHVADIGRSGTASHSSSDGTAAAGRARRYGAFAAHGECLWYGAGCADARTAVLDLIVDDGVESRGHRRGIYNAAYDCAGCAYGGHSTFGAMIAIEFARGWAGDDAAMRARAAAGPVRLPERLIAAAKAKAATQWQLGNCAVCGRAILGGKVAEVPQLGGKVHMDCFRCQACGEQLSGKGFKVQGKKGYCTACHGEKFAERCAACGQAILGAMAKCGLGSFHVECLACSACGKAIGKASFSTASGAVTCQPCSAGKARLPKSRLASAGAGIARSPKADPRPPQRPRSSSDTRPSTLGSSSALPPLQAKAPAAAKAPRKPKPKASMGQAKASLMQLAGDYGDLG